MELIGDSAEARKKDDPHPEFRELENFIHKELDELGEYVHNLGLKISPLLVNSDNEKCGLGSEDDNNESAIIIAMKQILNFVKCRKNQIIELHSRIKY